MRILALATVFSLSATSAMAQLATPILGADQANAIQGQMTDGSGLLSDVPLQAGPDAASAGRDVVKRANETVEQKAAKKAAIARGQAAAGPATSGTEADTAPAVPIPPPAINPETQILLQLMQQAPPQGAAGGR